MHKLVLQFKVRPEPRKRAYFNVALWQSSKSLSKVYQMPGIGALTLCHTTKKPLYADILLAQDQLFQETIFHEVSHAVLGWSREVGIDITTALAIGTYSGKSTSGEERLCYAMGFTCKQIIDQLLKNGYEIR
jgi:hypothetical protein